MKKKHPMPNSLTASLLLLTIAAISPAQSAPQTPVSTPAKSTLDAQFERGKKLFATYCTRCHGKNADGEGRMVIRLYRRMGTQLPSNFTINTYTDRPEAYMRKIIIEGGESNAMSKYMPPFGQELSSESVDDLVYFIHQVPEQAQDAKQQF